MRVLVIHNRYRIRGGEDLAVDREVALLRSSGVNAKLLEYHSSGIEGAFAKVKLAWNLPYSDSARLFVSAELERVKPDVVHVHNFFPLFTPSIYDACADAGLPVVQSLHNFRIFCASGLLAREGAPCNLCLGGSVLPAIHHACYRESRMETLAIARMIAHHRRESTWNKKVSLFVALSEFSRSKFIEGGIHADKIVVKPNFAPIQPAPPKNRERFALYVGRLSQEKGVLTLGRAWKSISFPLKIIGGGPLESELRSLVKENGNVQLLGEQPPKEVAAQMRRASLLLLPSECYENFPLVVAEAYSHGLPVLAAKIGSLAELITEGKNGMTFESGNPNSLRDVASSVVQNPEMLSSLGFQAYRDYLNLYTPEKNIGMLLNIYSNASAVVSSLK